MFVTFQNRDFWRFAWNVIVLHTITYVVFGIIFMLVNDYAGTFGVPGRGAEQMRPTSSIWVYLGPLFQPIRGLLYAVALYPFRQTILDLKRGWLALWGLLAIVGILSTSGPNPGSIEGFLYTRTPILLQLRFSLEIYLQTLAFSILLVAWEKHRVAKVGQVQSRAEGILTDVLKGSGAALAGVMGFAIVGGIAAVATGRSVEEMSSAPYALTLLWVLTLLNFGAAIWLGRTYRQQDRINRAIIPGVLLGINLIVPLLSRIVFPPTDSPPWLIVLNIIPAAFVTTMVYWLFINRRK